MMRKLTASILGTAVLAGGALTGVAAAAPSAHSHHHARTQMQTRERASMERTHREASANHERSERGR